MTAQPTQPPSPAAPTLGPYRVETPDKAMHEFVIVAPDGSSIADAEPGWPGYDPKEAAATANLLAASWATAAERDRLVAVNEGLVKALENTLADGCTCTVCTRVRAALDEARKPPAGQPVDHSLGEGGSPEGAGG